MGNHEVVEKMQVLPAGLSHGAGRESGMARISMLPRIDKKTLWLYVASILLLVLADPTETSFTMGLILVGLGETIRVWAAGYLRKNQILVTDGPYGYVKNPMYVGTILMSAGFCVMANNIYFLVFAFFGLVFYYIPHKKRVEHTRLRRLFGKSFVDYDAQVDDYMPRLKPYGKRIDEWQFERVVGNSECGVVVLVVIGIALIGMRFWI